MCVCVRERERERERERGRINVCLFVRHRKGKRYKKSEREGGR